jgi:hypothetical protein
MQTASDRVERRLAAYSRPTLRTHLLGAVRSFTPVLQFEGYEAGDGDRKEEVADDCFQVG